MVFKNSPRFLELKLFSTDHLHGFESFSCSQISDHLACLVTVKLPGGRGGLAGTMFRLMVMGPSVFWIEFGCLLIYHFALDCNLKIIRIYSSPPLIRPPCLPRNCGHIREVAFGEREN